MGGRGCSATAGGRSEGSQDGSEGEGGMEGDGVGGEDGAGGGGGGSGMNSPRQQRKTRVNREYGRAGRDALRANVFAAFPKFILASAALISIGGSLDFFKFYRSMKNGGADARWRHLAAGDRSGKEGHAGVGFRV